MSTPGSSTVKSAERALDVLVFLAEHPQPVPTMAIARACELPKSSAHHLLNVLRHRGFITYWESVRGWTLGVMTFEVGAAYLRDHPLQQLARPQLERVVERLDNTAHVAVLAARDVVYIDKFEPPSRAIRLVTEVGTRLPAHLTAVGRAILARLEDEDVAVLYETYEWPQRTGRGPRSVAELQVELSATRERGYAYESGGTTTGIDCVAAPVLTPSGRPAGAIGVTFIASTRTSAEVAEAGDVVQAAAQLLSASMLGDTARAQAD